MTILFQQSLKQYSYSTKQNCISLTLVICWQCRKVGVAKVSYTVTDQLLSVNKLPFKQINMPLGHDTTTSAMTWILYELAKHPDYMMQCQEEIDIVLKDNHGVVKWYCYVKIVVLVNLLCIFYFKMLMSILHIFQLQLLSFELYCSLLNIEY